jgi:hypothetical protein
MILKFKFRLNYASARQGFLVEVLGMVSVKRNTPEPSLIFTVRNFKQNFKRNFKF